MDRAENFPTTLQTAIIHFSEFENCREFMTKLRWPDGVVKCPHCGSDDVSYLPNAKVFKCYVKHPLQKFSLKVGTIFEDSPIALEKWLPIMWLLANCKNGVSSWEIHRALGVTQKTAWFMLQRARLAIQDENNGGTLGGEVEVDETLIGGKARNMHAHKKAKKIRGRGTEGKAIVAAVLERGGKVRTKVIDARRKRQLHELVKHHVVPGSTLYSDALKSYDGLEPSYVHEVVDHAAEYVRGNVHTNNAENFWSVLKRGISLSGTYISVEPCHLFRYVDEQAFRYNNREDMNDGDRFRLVMSQIVSRRLTYKQLIGKEGETSAQQPETI